jgi:very-short-patch-repair endonuclease
VDWHERERALSALADRQYGVVAVTQLRRLGFGPHHVDNRVAAHRLRRVHRGVYAVGHRQIRREARWLAAVLACGPDALLSHRSAAALWGVLDLERPRVDVTVPGRGARERQGIRIRRSVALGAEDRSEHLGIPVTSVPRTLLDLAGDVPAWRVRRAFEEAARLELLDRRGLERLVKRSRGRLGIAVVRDLITYDPSAAARTRSELEKDFLDFCREEGLPTPLVNTRLAGYEVDVYWPRARLVVELDSWEYHRSHNAFERDRAKASDLKLAGFEVVQVTDRRLRGEREQVRATLAALLALRPRGTG